MPEFNLFLYLPLFGNRKDTQFIQLVTLGNKQDVCTRREKLYVAEEIYSLRCLKATVYYCYTY